MIERLYRAYFTEQRSIFDETSLMKLASEAALDPDDARVALRERRYADAVQSDLDAARRLGATGVPFFVIDEHYGVSGAQAPEVFLDVLRQAAQR
jgi:predicted DsbA family dithiol-disulfide isomerase